MPKLRALSAKDIIAMLLKQGFVVVGQKGSHVKLRRESAGMRQILTIPMHNELDRGTTAAIYRQASRFVSETELHSFFFSE